MTRNRLGPAAKTLATVEAKTRQLLQHRPRRSHRGR
jgi:hypothetical protein